METGLIIVLSVLCVGIAVMIVTESIEKGRDKVKIGCATIHRVGDGIEIDGELYVFGLHYNKEMGDELHEYVTSHLGEVTSRLKSLGVHFEIYESLFRISCIS